MKFLKTKNISKASNMYFDHTSNIGYSYGWYQLAKLIKGKMILNIYNYSNTTATHKSKMWDFLEKRGYTLEFLEAPGGLQDLHGAKEYYNKLINDLEVLIKKPRTKPTTNQRRLEYIELYKSKIKLIESLL